MLWPPAMWSPAGVAFGLEIPVLAQPAHKASARACALAHRMMTNADVLPRSWAERPTPAQRSYSANVGGVPVEAMVKLANHLGAAPWFSMPHLGEWRTPVPRRCRAGLSGGRFPWCLTAADVQHCVHQQC